MAGRYEDGTGKRGRSEYPDEHVCADCKTDFKARYREARESAGKLLTKSEREQLKLATFAPIDYMIQGSLWAWGVRQIPRIDAKSTLCLDCLEKRLRRPLHPADFTPFPVNLENPLLEKRGLLECLVIGPYSS
jgi:hypothetical protein